MRQCCSSLPADRPTPSSPSRRGWQTRVMPIMVAESGGVQSCNHAGVWQVGLGRSLRDESRDKELKGVSKVRHIMSIHGTWLGSTGMVQRARPVPSSLVQQSTYRDSSQQVSKSRLLAVRRPTHQMLLFTPQSYFPFPFPFPFPFFPFPTIPLSEPGPPYTHYNTTSHSSARSSARYNPDGTTA